MQMTERFAQNFSLRQSFLPIPVVGFEHKHSGLKKFSDWANTSLVLVNISLRDKLLRPSTSMFAKKGSV